MFSFTETFTYLKKTRVKRPLQKGKIKSFSREEIPNYFSLQVFIQSQ